MTAIPHELVERIVRPEDYHWRIGRKVGRTIYIDHPKDGGTLIGVMDTAELAAEAVRCHNLDHDIRASR